MLAVVETTLDGVAVVSYTTAGASVVVVDVDVSADVVDIVVGRAVDTAIVLSLSAAVLSLSAAVLSLFAAVLSLPAAVLSLSAAVLSLSAAVLSLSEAVVIAMVVSGAAVV